MTSYKQALEKLGTRKSRKLENHTYLELHEDGDIAVRLHSTDVVTYKPNGDVVLDSGGWRTVTTKDRMNKYAPVSISQANGLWSVSSDGWRTEVGYQDGMTIKPDGTFEGASADHKAELKLRKQARKFADVYMKKLAAGEIPAPSNGDCLGCRMTTDKGETPMGGKDHMLGHIEEGYYVPSMIVRAFERFGAAPVQKWGLMGIWGKGEKGYEEYATDDRSKRMLTRHIYRELGLSQ